VSQLHVRRGAKDGDYLEFTGQGHETKDRAPGDVRFVFRTAQKHQLFQVRRCGAELEGA
jgi:DnaJ-class molecular chaperone